METTHAKHMGVQITGVPPEPYICVPFIHRFCVLAQTAEP